MNLKSYLEKVGKVVTQIVSFKNGEKKTLNHIKTDTIRQSQFTHMDTTDGRTFSINDKEVNWYETIKE